MTNFALPRSLQKLLAALTATLCAAAPAVGQTVIRGTVPGWPGNTAYYAPQTVYQYQALPAGGAPVVQARYAPQPAVAAYYAPASAARIAYAVPAAGSYQVSYAGVNQPGQGTTAYYGGYNAPVQRVAYLPQQVYYAPQAAGTPVTYYRTVVAYQPAAVAPQNCGYAATTCQTAAVSSCASSCGSNNSSCWRPFGWLWGNNSCGNNSCNKPQTCNYGGCGAAPAPYYVAPPVVPVVPVNPPVTSPFGRTIITPGPTTTTIPPPGTRSGPGTIINSAPADTRPMLGNPPGMGIPVNPNPTFTPTPSFGAPSPSFSAPPSGGGFPPVPGSIPADGVRDYRPTLVDPYSQPAAPANNAPIMLAPPAPSGSQPSSLQPVNPQPSSQILGSGYSSDRTNLIPANQGQSNQAPANRASTINEPGFIGPPSSVQPLRDPHGEDRNQPSINNRAPQLITPGDRTANNGQRWAVIPAVWPKNSPATNAELQPVSSQQPAYSQQQPAYSQQQPVVQTSKPTTTAPLAPVVAPTQLDDGGWKSAR